jgi:2,7-dihydroxy-5-methyl-1-naphthoate 7-O-methyltransferase
VNVSKNDAEVDLLSMASLYTPWALRAVATLRLADKVNEGATSVQELAELTGSNPDALARLMRHLVSIGVFSSHAAGGFHLDRLGRPLISSNSFRVVGMLDQEDAPVCALDEITPSLLFSLSSGNPSWSARYGTDFWAYFSATSDRPARLMRRWI